MALTNGYSQQVSSYKMASETVQKTRQLVMLYDAMIRFLKQGRLAMEESRFEDRLNLLQKASNIVIGLHSALDFEKGGEISEILNDFYSAIDLRIMSLNRSNSTSECDQIIREVKMMRDSWDKIDQELSLPIGTDVPATTVNKQVDDKVGADFSA